MKKIIAPLIALLIVSIFVYIYMSRTNDESSSLAIHAKDSQIEKSTEPAEPPVVQAKLENMVERHSHSMVEERKMASDPEATASVELHAARALFEKIKAVLRPEHPAYLEALRRVDDLK